MRQLVEEILSLSLLEVADLTKIMQERLHMPDNVGWGPMAGMGPMGGGMMQGQMPAAAPAAAAPPPPVEEKTAFNVKLAGYDAAAKIKIIKEVRALTSLGLKEAKDLVEKAPVVIKEDVKKEDAEAMKQKLVAAGAKIELE